jgi:hypothetical protein
MLKDEVLERIRNAISSRRNVVLRLIDLPSKTVDPKHCKLSESALIVSDSKNTAYFPITIIRDIEVLES